MLARTDETEDDFLQSAEHEIGQAIANFESARDHLVKVMAKHIDNQAAIAKFSNETQIEKLFSVTSDTRWVASVFETEMMSTL